MKRLFPESPGPYRKIKHLALISSVRIYPNASHALAINGCIPLNDCDRKALNLGQSAVVLGSK